jgi:hypothetical protein
MLHHDTPPVRLAGASFKPAAFSNEQPQSANCPSRTAADVFVLYRLVVHEDMIALVTHPTDMRAV